MEELEFTPSCMFSTVSAETGAGFYSSNWGPVPYAIGPEFRDRYMVDSAETGLDKELSLIGWGVKRIFSNRTVPQTRPR